MKKFLAILAGMLSIAGCGVAHAENADTGVDIPQVTSTPSHESDTQPDNNQSTMHPSNRAEEGDYQHQILSNPVISGIGRADSLTHGGGNTAIVVQKGRSNHSSVTQSGSDNYASHTQTGNDNDISVNQKGEHNRSDETQTGNHNHKIIIQNGKAQDKESKYNKGLNNSQNGSDDDSQE